LQRERSRAIASVALTSRAEFTMKKTQVSPYFLGVPRMLVPIARAVVAVQSMSAPKKS
jgi:hypothetical protein